MDSLPREESDAASRADSSEPLAEMTLGMRRGEATAWNEFHRRYYFPLLRHAAARLPSGEAEAAVQAAYLRVARHIKRFQNEDDFWRWLCCIQRCAILDQMRERHRSNRLRERFQLWTELWRSRHRGPARDDLSEALDDALHELADADATLLRRKYFEGWSTAELAAESCCTEKAIEGRLARLRATLKIRLSEGGSHA